MWVARTGWRPADVAARYPREKTDLSHFERYDPKVPRLVSVYAFFQLVSVVLLLLFMEKAQLSYWQGVAGWAVLLATTLTTAWWLDGRPAARLLLCEVLRLGGIGALLWLASGSGMDGAAWVWALLYGGVNVVMLAPLVRVSRVQPDEVMSAALVR